MEYALTVALTLMCVWGISNFIKRRKFKIGKIVYRQSILHKTISPFIPPDYFLKAKKPSQSQNRFDKNTVSVVLLGTEAYWVLNNVFYTADIVDGAVVPETTRPVDIQNLTKTEIDKMLSILDSLNSKDKRYDSGSAGDDRF